MIEFVTYKETIDYTVNHDPTSNINPKLYSLLLNTITGEMFTCINNEYDDNILKSHNGRLISTNYFSYYTCSDIYETYLQDIIGENNLKLNGNYTCKEVYDMGLYNRGLYFTDTYNNYGIFENISTENFILNNNYKISVYVNLEDTLENYGLIFGRCGVNYNDVNNSFRLTYNKLFKNLRYTHYDIARNPYFVEAYDIELYTTYKVDIIKNDSTILLKINDIVIDEINNIANMSNSIKYPFMIGSLYDRYGTQLIMVDLKFSKL